MYAFRSTPPQMTGARRPAASAMSVKRALNGSPEGLPRLVGVTFRVETPCPRRLGKQSSAANSRRVHMREFQGITRGGAIDKIPAGSDPLVYDYANQTGIG